MKDILCIVSGEFGLKTYSYIFHDQDVDDDQTILDGQISIVVTRDFTPICGPVAILDFREHQNKSLRRLAATPGANGALNVTVFRRVRVDGDDLPDGYVVMFDGGRYMVLSPASRIVGIFLTLEHATEEAWEHFYGEDQEPDPIPEDAVKPRGR
ncbi:hypothetical protein [Rhizobium tumorigenes]|uniref:Uncharacterized protein n=1 Tax=Rhizobium tumorigenes TaxID=2041385 RepID=A0AAF1KAF6_9HYPH|nr:hypothetical protein [Rhizobium tumorigenes]WFR97564.1 hypothetical protein PR017_20375 [Rhizobium tumorigenes]